MAKGIKTRRGESKGQPSGLYTLGTENVAWETYTGAYYGGTVTKNADHVLLSANNPGNIAGIITTNPVDLTNFTKIKVDVDVTNWRNEGNYLMVTSNKTTVTSMASLVFPTTGRATYELDISSINQSAYIRVCSAGLNGTLVSEKMYRVWLE